MKSRCYREKDKGFRYYGARGITVCDRWLTGDGKNSGVECFLADMRQKPSPAHTLDRRDVEKGYSPENCRWATYSEQNANRRPYRRGKTRLATEAARLGQ